MKLKQKKKHKPQKFYDEKDILDIPDPTIGALGPRAHQIILEFRIPDRRSHL